MQPYQAYRRGLISYQQYIQKKLTNDINVSENSSTATVFVGQMGIFDNETWTVNDGETTIGFFGADNDLTIDGTVDLNGESLFYTAGKGITISSTGTMNLRGSLTIKPY